MKAAVNKVTKKQIVGVWALASHAEQLFEVKELAVNVATYLRAGHSSVLFAMHVRDYA